MKNFTNLSKKKFHFDSSFKENAPVFGCFKLIQIGDLSCESGYEIISHPQKFFEITYVYSGKGEFIVDDKSYKISKGDLFYTRLNTEHKGYADNIDPFRFFYLAFELVEDGDNYKRMKDIIVEFERMNDPKCKDKFDVETHFIKMFNEIIDLKSMSSFMIKNYMEQILILTYRSFFERLYNRYSPNNLKTNSEKITYEVINYIDTNVLIIEDLSAISNFFDYSYNYLSHIFKKEMQMSIGDYYNKKRFDTALSWLTTTNMSVTDIATRLNYQTIHAFSREFKKRFGMSPSAYKQLHN